jgi:hypothetical protein
MTLRKLIGRSQLGSMISDKRGYNLIVGGKMLQKEKLTRLGEI